GTRILVNAYANVIVNKASGSIEGSYGRLVAVQPLYSALTKWGWDSQVLWDEEVVRRYVNAHLAGYNAKVTPQNDAIPWQYDLRQYSALTSVTRSFGWAVKSDVSLGASVDLREYRPPTGGGVDPAA